MRQMPIHLPVTRNLFFRLLFYETDTDIYSPIVEKAWNYLKTTALQADGKIGYIQPVGEKAITGQVVDANSCFNFGIGAFLLAACERVRFLQ